MKTTVLPHAPKCPKCGHILDAATSLENASPKPGDVTICVGCGNLLEFLKDKPWLAPISQEKLGALDEDNRKTLESLRNAIGEMLRKRRN